jgi:hypothetical protein
MPLKTRILLTTVGMVVIAVLARVLVYRSRRAGNKSTYTATALLGRLVIISAVTWPMITVYMVINNRPALHTTVVMPSWVPFWPAFTLPYLAMLFVTWLLPLTIRDGGRFRACLLAMVCAYLLVMPWWILAPTTLPRPPLPDGWWAGLYRSVAAIDAPNNVMPCAHGSGPVIAAWFVFRDRPTWRWPLIAMLVLGLPSIAFVWQHRPIDIVLGLVAAAVGIAVGEALNRGRQAGNYNHI